MLTAALHAASNERQHERVDYALRAACERFLRETQCTRTTISIGTVSGTRTVDATASSSGFMPGMLYTPPFIGDVSGTSADWQELSVVDWSTMKRLYREQGESGIPRTVSFLSPGAAYLHPVPDAVYAITFAFALPLNEFQVGSQGTYSSSKTYRIGDWVLISATPYRSLVDSNLNNAPASSPTQWHQRSAAMSVVDPDTTELNVPDRYMEEIINSGGLYHMLRGAPGRPEWREALAEFNRLIERAKGELMLDGIHYPDSRVYI